MVGIEFAHVGIPRPPGVVDFAPPDFDLVVASPTLELPVSPDFPSVAEGVSLLQGSVDYHVLVAAEGLPKELDVGDLLAESVGSAGSNEVETVFAVSSLDFLLGVVDVVVVEDVVLESFAVPGHSEGVAVLGHSISGGVIKLQCELVFERVIMTLGAVASPIAITALMGLAKSYAGDQDQEQGRGDNLFHDIIRYVEGQ